VANFSKKTVFVANICYQKTKYLLIMSTVKQMKHKYISVRKKTQKLSKNFFTLLNEQHIVNSRIPDRPGEWVFG